MNTIPKLRGIPEVALDTFGVYIGDVDQDEVLAAITAHGRGPGNEFIAYLHDKTGRLIRHHVLDLAEQIQGPDYDEPDDGDDGEPVQVVLVFAPANRHQSAGNPMVLLDAPLVLTFCPALSSTTSMTQYSGGVRLRFQFGLYEGHTLTLVFWQSVQHITGSGDVAPGFGPFDVQSKEASDG